MLARTGIKTCALYNGNRMETKGDKAMTFNDYQMLVHKTSGNKSCLEMCALGLAGESGEFADLVKKVVYHNHDLNVEKLNEELGDILWYIAEACTQLDISMGTIAERNIAKLKHRYPEGFSSERSINRKQDFK